MENNILEVMQEAIKNELEQYSRSLQAELTKKYVEEFKNMLREHRIKLVLDVAEKIKIGHYIEPSDMSINFTIKM